jgi:hypothetical protein
MDLTKANQFLHEHWLEIAGLFTLAVSLWIAFGPLRHRLPKVITRFGKYSATLKLVSLSGICWFLLYKGLVDDVPSAAINWLLGALGVILLVGAAFIVTRKQTQPVHPAPPHKPSPVPPLPRPRSSEPQAGV